MANFEDNSLEITRENLLNEMNGLSYEEFNFIPESTSWSIAQVCHHLVLSEKTFAKAIAYGLKKSNISTDPKNIHYMLDRSNKLEAPEMVKPQIDTSETQQIIEQLGDSRELLYSVLNAVDDAKILIDKSVKHPFFGDLPLFQWVQLVYLHEQRHIEQIKEIKLLYQASTL